MVTKEKKIKETTQHFSISNSFKTIFSTGSSGRTIAKEAKKANFRGRFLNIDKISPHKKVIKSDKGDK